MKAPPRYQPSRRLPAYAYLPGRTPHPTRAPDGHSYGTSPAPPRYLPDERWPENDEYLWGVDLYNAGYFWEAHEAWEGLWRVAAGRDAAQRRFLQGLIQCAAACLKATAGDVEACRRLAERGVARLVRARVDHDGRCMGLELASFVADFRRFAESSPTAVEHRPALWLADSATA
jgi:uncharacterized protein